MIIRIKVFCFFLGFLAFDF